MKLDDSAMAATSLQRSMQSKLVPLACIVRLLLASHSPPLAEPRSRAMRVPPIAMIAVALRGTRFVRVCSLLEMRVASQRGESRFNQMLRCVLLQLTDDCSHMMCRAEDYFMPRIFPSMPLPAQGGRPPRTNECGRFSFDPAVSDAAVIAGFRLR